MKIRQGFVSNSSTSSFCIYGVQLYCDDFVELIKNKFGKNPLRTNKYRSNFILYNNFDREFDGMPPHSSIIYCGEEDIRFTELLIEGDKEDYNFTIGLPPEAIGDEETGKQFRERVESALKDQLGITQKCLWHTEGWYDG